MVDNKQKYTFSGHDTFQCRQLWLKKGFDFLMKGKSFNDEDAVLELGVGKNMVSAIKFWLIPKKEKQFFDKDYNRNEMFKLKVKPAFVFK